MMSLRDNLIQINSVQKTPGPILTCVTEYPLSYRGKLNRSLTQIILFKKAVRRNHLGIQNEFVDDGEIVPLGT